jgi:hypothetical protein
MGCRRARSGDCCRKREVMYRYDTGRLYSAMFSLLLVGSWNDFVVPLLVGEP